MMLGVGRVDGWRATPATHHFILRNSWSSAAALAALDRCAGRNQNFSEIEKNSENPSARTIAQAYRARAHVAM